MEPLEHSAIKTYRYVRIAMVTAVVALGVAVLAEWWATADRAPAADRCLQTSISAYYYTPAQGIFVAALAAVGICLVVLKSHNPWEDVCLNVAGMLAAVVALVPTPYVENCFSVPVTEGQMRANVDNNVTALVVATAVAILVTVGVVTLDRAARGDLEPAAGLAVSAGLLLAGAAVFIGSENLFVRRAHYAAATIMFALITVVVAINAGEAGASREPAKRKYVGLYGAVAVAMPLGAAALYGWGRITGWAHWVLGVEMLLIVLFAVFWILQTIELWGVGLRRSLRWPLQARD